MSVDRDAAKCIYWHRSVGTFLSLILWLLSAENSASEMTYIVSSGALNSTHSLISRKDIVFPRVIL